jgi:hypothetical protein
MATCRLNIIAFFFFLKKKQMRKANPRELNPYFKDDGSGYPEETDGSKSSGAQLLSSSVVGDGGASWRLKALKRAREQAAREGRRLDEVCCLNFKILASICAISLSIYLSISLFFWLLFLKQ